jgi:hypothetical protein
LRVRELIRADSQVRKYNVDAADAGFFQHLVKLREVRVKQTEPGRTARQPLRRRFQVSGVDVEPDQHAVGPRRVAEQLGVTGLPERQVQHAFAPRDVQQFPHRLGQHGNVLGRRGAHGSCPMPKKPGGPVILPDDSGSPRATGRRHLAQTQHLSGDSNGGILFAQALQPADASLQLGQDGRTVHPVTGVTSAEP